MTAIKSLLLGSTATLAAASSALAADALIVEPEPTQYVRVCDAYGSGFFYIPGTETCIRFSGFVRSAYEKNQFDGTYDGSIAGVTLPTAPPVAVGAGGTFDNSATLWGQRARLDIDTRNETDWGTLRAV